MNKNQDIPQQYTWDLSFLYPSITDWENDLKEIEKLATEITAKKGTITTSAQNLWDALTLMDQLAIKLEKAASYARMDFDVNMANSQAKGNYEKIYNLLTKIRAQLSFYEPELLQMTPSLLNQYKQEITELDTYSFMFEKLFKEKEHILSPQEEKIISRLNSLGGTFKQIFDQLSVNDLNFPEIEGENGKIIKANEANYRLALNSYNRELRKTYFKSLLGTYGSHLNTFATIAAGNIKHHVFQAQIRKYPSTLALALEKNHIPISVYDQLIDTVRSNVQQLQDYLKLRKKLLGYDTLHFYDLFVPLVEDINKSYTYEEAQDIVLNALSLLGNDYIRVLKQAFSERWIDVFPKQGKTSGAYANGIYDAHPYSLLNFTGTLDDVFTIAHELGHVMHSYYSNKNQPYILSDYVIFTAEVASTVNEYLLYQYLLRQTTNIHEKKYLLNMHLDSIRSTFYRQTFFADFERQIHQKAEEEIPLTPEIFCHTYRELYAYYHGPEFTIDEELTYEWTRIPHFFSPFYVYQYATGISAAITLAQGILEQKPGALENYLHFLTTGGSDYPLNLLKKAGVDMSTSEPIITTIQDFSTTLDLFTT
ncbi:MAG: oligoendopeptidase F [Clostridia bacterium]|nr:oligoendopeptidase F [Clostridia bacterium]